jgi:hypothetical protein
LREYALILFDVLRVAYVQKSKIMALSFPHFVAADAAFS